MFQAKIKFDFLQIVQFKTISNCMAFWDGAAPTWPSKLDDFAGEVKVEKDDADFSEKQQVLVWKVNNLHQLTQSWLNGQPQFLVQLFAILKCLVGVDQDVVEVRYPHAARHKDYSLAFCMCHVNFLDQIFEDITSRAYPTYVGS